ncbi:cobyrinate a,c-diamide synthase [Crocosphaera sp. Alani8]|uniref:cobyrinate a,c-diamide synthase n=1 Tax=Crocosphaera sp. Alani8 TaxID=3038952 RepID=UPI00313EF5BC
MTLIIAGDRSGTGKTTVTLALLAFLKQKSAQVQSFKVGPDYIDPMFHSYITGRPCRNLDPILTSIGYVKSCFAQHCQGVDYALIEGVMGLFDGVPFQKAGESKQETVGEIINPNLPGGEEETQYQNYGSTAHIAKILKIPVVLVIDCSRLSGSVAAIAYGYGFLDADINLVGVILNRVGSDRHLALLKTALEPLNIAVLGVIYRQESLTIPDRHLGLVPTQELPEIDCFLDRLAYLAENCFNWEQLLPYLTTSSPNYPISQSPYCPVTPLVKIAIAQDKAFNFYYSDNLDILEQWGAKLCYWSPMNDESLPEGVAGLYFGGGFPEMFASALSSNKKALKMVKEAIERGMPTYAECGGLMYLCEKIVNFEGNVWPMVGILGTTAKMGKKLTLGYKQGTALRSSLLLNLGEVLWGHEFHRSELTIPPSQPLFHLSSWHTNSPSHAEGWYHRNLHSSYLHLHFGGCPQIAARFFRHTLDFSKYLTLD